jgi:hypothetical protein
MIAGRTDIIGAGADLESSFCGNQNLVSPTGDGAAKNLFRFPVGINIGGVEHVDAGFQADINEPSGFVNAGVAPGAEKFIRAAKCAGAQA